jgi:hypothetical protein
MNLGRLSVVQQRLAQIERNSSQESSGSDLTSPTPSSRGSRSTHLTTPSLHSGKATNPYDALESKRIGSMKSSSIKLIVDSYSDTQQGSSKSPAIELVETPDFEEPTKSLPVSPRSTEGAITSRLEPFAELLRDHAAKNYDQTANLGDQIISLQDEVQRLPHELASVVSDGSSCTDIHKIISSLEAKTGANGEILKAISEKFNTTGTSSLVAGEVIEIRQTLQSIRHQLDKDFPVILRKLDQVHERQEQDSSKTATTFDHLDFSQPSSADPPQVIDLSELHKKLDTLANLYHSNLKEDEAASVCQPPPDGLSHEVRFIIWHL